MTAADKASPRRTRFLQEKKKNKEKRKARIMNKTLEAGALFHPNLFLFLPHCDRVLTNHIVTQQKRHSSSYLSANCRNVIKFSIMIAEWK